MSKVLLNNENYNPQALLDELVDRLELKNQAALSRLLNVGAPIISKIKKRHIPISGDMLIRIYDFTGIPIDELRAIGGIPKADGTYLADHDSGEIEQQAA